MLATTPSHRWVRNRPIGDTLGIGRSCSHSICYSSNMHTHFGKAPSLNGYRGLLASYARWNTRCAFNAFIHASQKCTVLSIEQFWCKLDLEPQQNGFTEINSEIMRQPERHQSERRLYQRDCFQIVFKQWWKQSLDRIISVVMTHILNATKYIDLILLDFALERRKRTILSINVLSSTVINQSGCSHNPHLNQYVLAGVSSCLIYHPEFTQMTPCHLDA